MHQEVATRVRERLWTMLSEDFKAGLHPQNPPTITWTSAAHPMSSQAGLEDAVREAVVKIIEGRRYAREESMCTPE